MYWFAIVSHWALWTNVFMAVFNKLLILMSIRYLVLVIRTLMVIIFLLWFIFLLDKKIKSLYKNYQGTRCENKIDFCSFADYCNLFPGLNPFSECTSLSSTEQESTGLLYKCTGNCSSGFTKNRNGACIGESADICILRNSKDDFFYVFPI